jgi:hypothetical protein
MAENPKFLSRAEAASYLESTWGLKRSKATLAKLAVSGKGPSYHRSGRDALYTTASLDSYAEQEVGLPAPQATQHKIEAILKSRGVAA